MDDDENLFIFITIIILPTIKLHNNKYFLYLIIIKPFTTPKVDPDRRYF